MDTLEKFQTVVPCTGNLFLKLTAYENGILRITGMGYDEPDPSLLERYELIEQLKGDMSANFSGRTVRFDSDTEFEVLQDGGWGLRKNGKTVAATLPGNYAATAPTLKRNQGWCLKLKADAGEKYLGFGDSERSQLLLNGLSGELWMGAPTHHIPIPFMMSSKGYGIFFNTTRSIYYDICSQDSSAAVIHGEKDYLDCWIFTGNNFYQLLDKYTSISGRPHLPPVKSFGLWLTLYYYSDANTVQFVADGLRTKKIPCDNLSLDPGWLQTDYDATVNKDWNHQRFAACNPKNWRGAFQTMISSLKEYGFNLGLWLCCAWDFTHEEERRISAGKKAEKIHQTADGSEKDFIFADHRTFGQYRFDQITQPDQNYFKHLEKFADDGVSFFKLDGSYIMNEFPDRMYANGKGDEEMHNITFVLEAKHTFGDFERYTNKRSYGIYPAGYAGCQRYAGSWTGDTGGGEGPMVAILRDSISGHPFATCDVENTSVQGLHMGFLLPWTVIDCWATAIYPGFLKAELNDITRFYSELRMQLVPFYYSLAAQAHRSGAPILRPLCFEWPEQEWTYSQNLSFMIGESILADVYGNDEICLPEGRWYDFWTGKIYSGNNQKVTIPVPENRGGHLLIREGALIPTMKVQQYITPGKLDEIEWLVFPSESGKSTEFDLYMDDGVSLEHRSGAYALQRVTLNGEKLSFGEISGDRKEFLVNVTHKVRILK